jgi:hypothetical protein
LSWGKRVASSRRKIRGCVDARRDASWPKGRRVPEPMPPRKTSREDVRARTKTDTGGQAENAKAIEITFVKELGKFAP